jgi:hypothetical protein
MFQFTISYFETNCLDYYYCYVWSSFSKLNKTVRPQISHICSTKHHVPRKVETQIKWNLSRAPSILAVCEPDWKRSRVENLHLNTCFKRM